MKNINLEVLELMEKALSDIESLDDTKSITYAAKLSELLQQYSITILAFAKAKNETRLLVKNALNSHKKLAQERK